MEHLNRIAIATLALLGLTSCNLTATSPVYIPPISLSEANPLKIGGKSGVQVTLAKQENATQWLFGHKSSVAFLQVDFGENPVRTQTLLEKNFSVRASSDTVGGNYTIKIIAVALNDAREVIEERSQDLLVTISN